MMLSFAVRFLAVAHVVLFAGAVSATDPATIAPSPSIFATRTEAVVSNATLVSLPTPKNGIRSVQAEVNVAPTNALPANTISALREVYVWAWPLVYMSNLKQSMNLVRSPGRSGGAPVAPVNSLCMLTEVVSPDFQSVPCPNRDVVYGFGLMDLSKQPVVVQVPDFGDRFWLYQVGDHRMESIGQVGSMYATQPGYLAVVGPEWRGELPASITTVIHSRTNLAYIMPRILVGQGHCSTEDAALQATLSHVAIYPLSKFSGNMKQKDWQQTRWYPALGRSTRERSKLVRPENFFQDLQRVVTEIEPTLAERPLVELAMQIVQWSQEDPSRQAHLQELADYFERETIQPMFDFSYGGQLLPGYWRTIRNGAAFGDDYWTRTAIAKSNPFVNRELEAKYFYLEQAANGTQLQGGQTYRLKFAADQLPPADGFWSLTLYNADHQLHANEAKRYSLGSADGLVRDADGSLTLIVGPERPLLSDAATNWLPSPATGSFKLYLRLYQPQAAALQGSWTPPAVVALDDQ